MTKRNTSESRLKNRLAEICDARGIKPSHLALRIGKQQSTISEIVNQIHNPDPDTLVKLCDELRCQVGDVLYVAAPAENNLS